MARRARPVSLRTHAETGFPARNPVSPDPTAGRKVVMDKQLCRSVRVEPVDRRGPVAGRHSDARR